MKMTKKKVFVVALAVCLVAVLSMGTLAWFSAQDEVTNEFLVATDEDDKTDFSVDVWENRDANGDGDYDDEGDAEKNSDGLVYENILPGDVLSKEVHVENTGAYDQYLRVIVEISNASAWVNALGTDYKFENCFVGFEQDQWYPIGVNKYLAEQDLIVVVLYYNQVLEAGKDVTLFDAVQIPTELTVDHANALGNGFEINVKAHVIQADNVGDNIWAAFNEVIGWKALDEYTNS